MTSLASHRPVAAAESGSRRRRLTGNRRAQLWGAGFVLPSLLFFLVFKFIPMGWAVGLSFTSYDMMSPPHFIGLANYQALAGDPVFVSSLVNTLTYTVSSTVLITLVGLALALAINTAVPGARQCMALLFVSNLVPIIVVCLIWRFLLLPFGLVNQLLHPFGVGRIDWLTSSATAMPAIVMVTVWRFAPYFMVIFLAGLLAIPRDYYEAAEIDGASRLQRFWHVTLPQLAPTTFFVVVVSALLCARIFLMPYIMTTGGPGNATRVLSMLIYETGFSYMNMGRAAAISVVLFGITLLFTLGQFRFFSRGEQEASR